MFARQCFTYIFCGRWKNESAVNNFFVALQQLVALENSSLTSCIFLVGISFRNPSWLNIVVGDAISLVRSYTYMEKCTIHNLKERTTRQPSKSCRIIVSLRSWKLLLTTAKQRTLLMLLAARLKLFLPMVYTYYAHTSTLMVTTKWFIWSHSSNIWIVRRPLRKRKEKSTDNLGTTYQEWMTIPCV